MQAPIKFTYNDVAIHQEPEFQIVTLALFALCCIYIALFSRERGKVSALFSIPKIGRDIYSAQHSKATQGNRELFGLIQIVWSLLFALISLRLISEQGYSSLLPHSLSANRVHLALTLVCIPMALWVYQWSLIMLIGLVSEYRAEASIIVKGQLSSNAMGSIVTAPIMLLLLLSEVLATTTLLYTVVFLLVLMLINDVIQSFYIFTSQKISTLDWILYLCTIKIIPLSFIWRILTM